MPLFSARSLLLVAACSSLTLGGCFEIGAPPAQDTVGEGLKTEGGSLIVDRERVPLIRADETCGTGEVAVKTATDDLWECQRLPDESGGDYTAGTGILINNDTRQVSANIGTGPDNVAGGDALAAVDTRLIQVENTVNEADIGALSVDTLTANAGTIDAVTSETLTSDDIDVEKVVFRGQKLCVYDGGAVLVGADWTQARCIELVTAIGATNPRFACVQANDFDIGDGPALVDGGPPAPPNDGDDCGWCAPAACPTD